MNYLSIYIEFAENLLIYNHKYGDFSDESVNEFHENFCSIEPNQDTIKVTPLRYKSVDCFPVMLDYMTQKLALMPIHSGVDLGNGEDIQVEIDLLR